MFVSFVIAIFLTFVNLRNCPNDYDQFRTENSTNLQKKIASELDKTLEFATEYLDNLYFEKFGKKRCKFMCHNIYEENVTITRKFQIDSFMHVLNSARVKHKKRLCTLLWKCKM